MPSELVGRTPTEVATRYEQLARENQQLWQSQWGGQRPAPQPAQPSYGYAAPSAGYSAPTASASALEPPKPEDFLNDQAGATKRYADYLAATQFQPALQAQALAAAQTNRTLVQMQRGDEFRRWGGEIDTTLRQMAPNPNGWTPDNINAVVDIVKARHVNELIAEERAKYQNELGGVALRPTAGGAATGTSAGSPDQVDFEKLPPSYRAALQKLNVDQRTIDEFLTRTYLRSGMEPTLEAARKRWTDQALRGEIFSDNRTLESPVYT